MFVAVVAVLTITGGAVYSVLNQSPAIDAGRHRLVSLVLLIGSAIGLVAGGWALAAYGTG